MNDGYACVASCINVHPIPVAVGALAHLASAGMSPSPDSHMHILIVDDDLDHANALHMTLSASGHVVTQISMTVPTLDAHPVELLIVSLDPHEESGMQMLMAVRAQGQQLPILAMSSSDSPEHIAWALDHGADDCMVKPMAMAELVARVLALRRRCHRASKGIIRNGSLKYQTTDRSVYLHDQLVHLSPNETTILSALFRSLDRVVITEYLADNLMNHRKQSKDSALAVNVHRLRAKIGRESAMIETVRGFGYRLRRAS